ncbi:MAG: hypothetical protein DRO88_07470 [Promethearchaeia archaeon]|nr:MAG: hypothetical protein DRO88_07470 [Candidatus Lokiarchaeia archaeon]
MAIKKKDYVRVSATVPWDLNDQFEQLRNKIQLSRSDAIRRGMRLLINQNIDNLSEPEDIEVLGTIAYIEKTHSHDLNQPHHHPHSHPKPPDQYYFPVDQAEFIQINELQHQFLHEIISTTHIHASKEKCMIIIAVRGKMHRINDLLQKLQSFHTIQNLQFIPLEKLQI